MYLDRDCRTEVALRNEIIVAILSHLEMKICRAQPQMILSLVSFPRKQALKWRFAFRSLSGGSLGSNTSEGERAAGWDEGYEASPAGDLELGWLFRDVQG